MILTTLSDLPLLFFLWCRKINCCHMYNIHYCLQRCRLVALYPLFSSLFRCDSICCFLCTYDTFASNPYRCIYHTSLPIFYRRQYCVFYTTQSQFTLLTILYFYNIAMLCSTHHICAQAYLHQLIQSKAPYVSGEAVDPSSSA